MAFVVPVFTKLTFTQYTSVNICICFFPTQMKNERAGGRCNFIDAFDEVLLSLHRFHKIHSCLTAVCGDLMFQSPSKLVMVHGNHIHCQRVFYFMLPLP